MRIPTLEKLVLLLVMRWSRVEQLTEVEPSKLYIRVGWLIRAENPSEFRVLMYSFEFDTMFDLLKSILISPIRVNDTPLAVKASRNSPR